MKQKYIGVSSLVPYLWVWILSYGTVQIMRPQNLAIQGHESPVRTFLTVFANEDVTGLS